MKLHLSHSWGGGIEYWIRSFFQADKNFNNIVLKSFGTPSLSGQRLALYTNIESENPDHIWNLTNPIHATSITNQEYRGILNKIISDYKVKSILISSFIGHSLDILNTKLKTGVICHDFYPLCPAVNIYFNEICNSCKYDRLKRCFQRNDFNKSFPLGSPFEWILIRNSYLKLINRSNVFLVAPSASVIQNLYKIEPLFKETSFKVIPHGLDFGKSFAKIQNPKNNRKLKLLILGRISFHKGLELFNNIYKELIKFTDIYFLGCGKNGLFFRNIKGIHIISENYIQSDLPNLVAEISPDLGILLSVWPETFSYTLSELMVLKIPTLAMKVGSFEDRISNGINGFLVEPEEAAVIRKIKELSENRQRLKDVSNNLNNFSHRSVKKMISEYIDSIDTVPDENDLGQSNDSYYNDMLKTEKLRINYQIRKTYEEYDRLHMEKELLKQSISEMRASKFWKLRNFCYKSKRIFK